MHSRYSIKQGMLKAQLLLDTRMQRITCSCFQNPMMKLRQRSNIPRSKMFKEKKFVEWGSTRAGRLCFPPCSLWCRAGIQYLLNGWVNEDTREDNTLSTLSLTYVVVWVCMHYSNNCRWRLVPWVSKLGEPKSLQCGTPGLLSASTITSNRRRTNYIFLGFVSSGT